MSIGIETAELRQEIRELASRDDAVEGRLAQTGSSGNATLDLDDVVPAIREISQLIFPGRCDLTSEFDFDFPRDQYLLVSVDAEGEPGEIVEKSKLWHSRIAMQSERLSRLVRLYIVPH